MFVSCRNLYAYTYKYLKKLPIYDNNIVIIQLNTPQCRNIKYYYYLFIIINVIISYKLFFKRHEGNYNMINKYTGIKLTNTTVAQIAFLFKSFFMV